MLKKQYLALAVSAALAASAAQALDAGSFTITGNIKNETGMLQNSGSFNGETTSTSDTTQHHKSQTGMKAENSLRLFVNGDIGDSSMHAELLLQNDHLDKTDLREFSQSEYLRELYIDTEATGWDFRVGKQQVVWGTADGAKLLDLINPTDYREMAQNKPDESRIPVWMLKADKYNDDGSSFQAIISQPRENVFAGLNREISATRRNNGAIANSSYTSTLWSSGAHFSQWSDDTSGVGHDKGSPFILKGVDSITGQYNGFLNIVPDIGSVAALFGRAFEQAGTNTNTGLNPNKLYGKHAGFTVGGFNTSTKLGVFSNQLAANISAASGSFVGFEALNFGQTFYWRDDDGNPLDDVEYLATSAANSTVSGGAGSYWTGLATLAGFAGKFETNLDNTSTTAVDSVFEYMDRTSFATFDAFVNADSEYILDMPKDTEANIAFAYRNTTPNGLNYSLNYSYNYDPNPVIKMSWRDPNGNEISTITSDPFYTADTDSIGDSGYGVADAVKSAYLTFDTTAVSSAAGTNATLRMTQTMERAHNIGGSLDFAVDTESLGPVVIRAEGVYQKDVYSPIVDRGKLAIGDLVGALQMKKGDKFKYVLGADFNVLTDMMISGQFIQERNLDFQDKNIDFDGTACTANNSLNAANCGVYTADFAAMHMSNGFKKAEENKEFYSLFFSKPFGASGEGRWNNILMLEEGGGRWNRFDVEYSMTDSLIGSIEFNNYWGDKNTQFGQLENASNIQIGLKYLLQ